MDSLARLQLFKSTAYLGATTDANDDAQAALLAQATKEVENWLGRALVNQAFDEYYTGNDANRLYLIHSPITTVESVEIFDGDSWEAQDATEWDVHNEYLFYEKHGVTTADYTEWPSEYENGIRIKYHGGYNTADWRNASETAAWTVPDDLEAAVLKIAWLKWLDTPAGKGRIGVVSINRGGESMGYEKYIQGWPEDVLMTLQNYRRPT